MNPLHYYMPPAEDAIEMAKCPRCAARAVFRRRETFRLPMHRVGCARCATRTREFPTWVGALAAWDRFDLQPPKAP